MVFRGPLVLLLASLHLFRRLAGTWKYIAINQELATGSKKHNL